MFKAAQTFTIYSLKICESLKRKLSSVHKELALILITFQFPKQITTKSKNKRERFSRQPDAAQRL